MRTGADTIHHRFQKPRQNLDQARPREVRAGSAPILPPDELDGFARVFGRLWAAFLDGKTPVTP